MTDYLLLIVPLSLIFYSIYVFFFQKVNDPTIKLIKEKFTNPKSTNRDYSKISIFGKYLSNNDKGFFINDQTSFDIDLHDIFAEIDNTSSKVGQQYLYFMLHKLCNTEAELQKLDINIELVNQNKDERIKSQSILKKLNKEIDYLIPSLFFDQLPAIPKWYFITHILQSLLAITLFASFYFPILFIVVIIIFATNTFVHYKSKFKNIKLFSALGRLFVLYNTGKKLSKSPLILTEDKVRLVDALENCNNITKKIKYLNEGNSNNGGWSQAAWYFLELFNILTLIEVQRTYQVCSLLEKQKNHFITIFKIIGNLDSSIAISSYRRKIPYYCKPNFIDSFDNFSFENIYHPLINGCQANSITEVNNQSIFITGSNMSGKTTFIRTVAINALLAQTIFTCFALEFSIPLCNIYSSIRVTDNLQLGTSYYLQEIILLRDFIYHSQDEKRANLFIIDEILKGTNAYERLKISKQILLYITKRKNNFVFVTSHDFDLSTELKNNFQFYYFKEIICDNNLKFDFKLQKGMLEKGNAIELMKILDFPEEIIFNLS